jgi:putative phage-type endonuclease
MQQGSKEWLAHRKNYIGASDAPIIMGVSPWRTQYQLWQEKLGLNEGQKETEAMRYGKRKEEEARRAYEKYTGNLLSTDEKDTLIYHPKKKFMMASLDGITFDRSIAVELKNANAEDHALAKKGEIPEKYYPQVQHQFACESFNMLHYFSYREGDFALVEVTFDPPYINRLYEAEERFWDYVLSLESPPLTDRDYCQIDDDEWRGLATEWFDITKQLNALEKREKEYREALVAKANGMNAKGCGICLSRIVRKGTVDYKKVPELIGVDLEKYRKSPSESWRIVCQK